VGLFAQKSSTPNIMKISELILTGWGTNNQKLFIEITYTFEELSLLPKNRWQIVSCILENVLLVLAERSVPYFRGVLKTIIEII